MLNADPGIAWHATILYLERECLLNSAVHITQIFLSLPSPHHHIIIFLGYLGCRFKLVVYFALQLTPSRPPSLLMLDIVRRFYRYVAANTFTTL